jgi:hypothetical protein
MRGYHAFVTSQVADQQPAPQRGLLVIYSAVLVAAKPDASSAAES